MATLFQAWLDQVWNTDTDIEAADQQKVFHIPYSNLDLKNIH